jgi:hypothetical protein
MSNNQPVSSGQFELSNVVATASPELYAAAVRTNITHSDRNMLENWASIKNTHLDLMALPNDQAKKKYDSLNPDLQRILTDYYQVDYSTKSHTAGSNADETMNNFNKIKWSDSYKSPFRFLLEVGAQWSEIINTPYRALEQSIINGDSLANRKTWDMAASGQYLYDEDLANKLIETHGGALSYAAMHILAGQTPGEIIDSWGATNPEILDALDVMFNDPEKFQSILTDFDRAKLSVGRNTARWLNNRLDINDEANHKLFKVMGKEFTIFDLESGTLDAAFQIFADPLTYLSGGLSVVGKGGTKAQKLAKAIKENGRTAAEHFSIPEVAKYFDGYTEKIAEYTKAVNNKNYLHAAKVRNEIARFFPEHGTAAEIDVWSKAGIDSTKAMAELLDKDAVKFQYIIRGRTTDQTYQREGAAYASRTRSLKLATRNKLNDIFTGKQGFETLDETTAKDFVKDLIEGGKDLTGTHAYDDATKILDKINRKNVQNFLRYMTAIHPGNKIIYVNERAHETIDVFRRQANLVFENKAIAELLSQVFLTSHQMERVAIKKSLDELTLRKMGVHGVSGGEDYMRTILADKYGATESFAAGEKVQIPSSVKNSLLGNNGIKLEDELNLEGPVHPYQMVEAISALDYRKISEFLAMRGLANKDLNAINAIPEAIGGAFNSRTTGKLTDLWTMFTLAPMLGIRTAIDEGFMFAMYADFGIAAKIRPGGRAKKAGKALAAYSGDPSATGPLKALLFKGISKTLGVKIGPLNFFTDAERMALRERHEKIFFSGGYNSYDEMLEAAKNDLLDLAVTKYNISEEDKIRLKRLIKFNPNFMKSVSSESIIDTLLPRKNVLPSPVLNETQYTKMLDDYSLEESGNFLAKRISDMKDSELDAVMFSNFYKRFYSGGFNHNGKKIKDTNLAELFIRNRGLEHHTDVNNAIQTFMKGLGFKHNPTTGAYILPSGQVPIVKDLLLSSRQSAKYLNDTMSNLDDAALRFAADGLSDIYTVFHGSSKQFNADLLAKFNDYNVGRVGSYKTIMDNITFEEYRDLIKNHKAVDTIYTDIQPVVGDNLETIWGKFFDKTFEVMSRQTDSMIRQPIVLAHYLQYSEEYEKLFARTLQDNIDNLIKQGNNPKWAEAEARRMFEANVHEVALRQSVDRVLKYVDNPEMRTTLAFNMRTVGRFYRAVEDFWRRMYRLVEENGIGTIYRLRLINQGMAGVGAVHKDQNGDAFVIMPMDDVIFGAVDSSIRRITGNSDGVRQPLFNDLTFKLTAGNPSFQTDAGMPYLSGPAGAISVVTAKWILGKFDVTANLAEDLDNVALGDLGDNVTLKSAITPKLLRNIWRATSPDEKSVEEISALTQAMSYYQAHNLVPHEDDFKTTLPDGSIAVDEAAFNAAKQKYLDNVRITAHNIIVTRSLLGMILPFSIQAKDFKDLPDYLKNSETTSMSGSFYDVLKHVESNYTGMTDPYEQTLAMWTAKNPGKLAYTVSKNSSEIKTLMTFSNEMQNWAIKNRDSVKKYGDGALIFAPRIGEFSPGVWTWANAAELVSNIPEGQSVDQYINNYFDSLRLRQYVNAYYKTYDDAANRLVEVPYNDMDSRRKIIYEYENIRAGLKISVPGLKNYLDSGRDKEANINFVDNVYSYINSGNTDVPADVIDKANSMYNLYMDLRNNIAMIKGQGYDNEPDIKRQYKEATIDSIKLMIQDDSSGALNVFFKYGLEPLINDLSRDARSGLNTNVVK